MAQEQKFETVFKNRLKKIEADAKNVGINMTVVCREAGVGRATPDRWHRQVPKTIEIVEKMEGIVEKHRLERLKAIGQV